MKFLKKALLTSILLTTTTIAVADSRPTPLNYSLTLINSTSSATVGWGSDILGYNWLSSNNKKIFTWNSLRGSAVIPFHLGISTPQRGTRAICPAITQAHSNEVIVVTGDDTKGYSCQTF